MDSGMTMSDNPAAFPVVISISNLRTRDVGEPCASNYKPQVTTYPTHQAEHVLGTESTFQDPVEDRGREMGDVEEDHMAGPRWERGEWFSSGLLHLNILTRVFFSVFGRSLSVRRVQRVVSMVSHFSYESSSRFGLNPPIQL